MQLRTPQLLACASAVCRRGRGRERRLRRRHEPAEDGGTLQAAAHISAFLPHPQIVAEGADPNAAWDAAANRQKMGLEAALAREKALKPPSAKKAPMLKDAAAAVAGGEGAAGAAAGGAAAAGGDDAAAPVDLTGDGSQLAPTANGVASPAAEKKEAKAAAAGDTAAEAEAAGKEEAEAERPPDLGSLDKLLVEAAPLAGAWGEERYGFADGTVLQVRGSEVPGC